MNKSRVLLILSAIAFLASGCSIDDPITLLRCQFRVENTQDFALAGIMLDDLESLSVTQVTEVVALWASGSCPVDFTLNVGIYNPNDGSSSPDIIPVTLTGFAWDLYLDADSGDDFDTTWVASGSLGQPLEVPGSGETVILPLDIGFDAVALMSELGALQFIDLALAIGGLDSDLRDNEHLGRMLVVGVPTISTPIGQMTYSGALNISLDWVD